jgi:hypothetical protein
MQTSKLRNLLLNGLLLFALSAGAAQAALVQFAFSGDCDDCVGGFGDGQTQPVTGTLVLDNFVAGEELTVSNFERFTYDGSNILSPFTITSISSISGRLDSDGSVLGDSNSSLLFISSQSGLSCSPACNLYVAQNGNWVLGDSDQGDNGAFSPVPLPSPLLLMLAALGGPALIRRVADLRRARRRHS